MLPLSCALLCCHSAVAIDRISFSATRIDAPAQVVIRSARARLQLPARAAPQLEVQAASLQQPVLRGGLGPLRLRCGRVVLQEPLWQCDAAQLQMDAAPVGAVRAELAIRLDSAHGRADLAITGMPVAGGSLRLNASIAGGHWQVTDATLDTTLQPVVQWLQRWWQPPPGLQYAGRLSLQADAAGQGTALDQLSLQARLRDLNLQNAAGTLVTENLMADVSVQLHGPLAQPTGTVQLASQSGQLLAGPAWLDFAAHPTQVRGNLQYQAPLLTLGNVHLSSAGLAELDADAQVALAPTPVVRRLHADVTRLEFPAAYASFLQLPLAATNFGSLDTHGSLSAQLQLADNRLTSLDLTTGAGSLELADASRGLALSGLGGEFHWLAGAATAAAPSSVHWQALHAFGLRGGSTTLQLHAQGDAVRLMAPVRVPIFDGALAVQRFAAQGLGSADVTLAFDGQIDAIGMPELSRAFGWPEMAGTLSGQLPGLEYRGGTLRVAGDLAAQVFDGTIVASGLQLRDVFGRFPRLSGNFTARRLDLDMMTRTFPIGSITGRLDADVRGLELFGWRPVAFDARLLTSPGDRSRHRISQRAVSNLANLGGGGGGVMAALQSGFLRFFDDFGYDRIGLRCQLRDDVCLMDGIARPEGGFYIVKGRGLPRLDVIGASGRIAWSQLVEQVGAALANGGLEVR